MHEIDQHPTNENLRPAGVLPFEQQPRESSKAFAAFKVYLELGPERSLVAVGNKLGKGATVIERWSRKFDWPARVQAHSAHLAMVELKAAEAVATRNGVDWAKRQEEHREEEWQARSELLSLAREAIKRWKKSEHRCGTLEGIARLIDLASKLGRVSSGLSLEPADSSPEENGAFMIQIDVALEKIYGQAVPAPILAEPTANVLAINVVDVECTSPQPSPQSGEGEKPAALVAAPLANSTT